MILVAKSYQNFKVIGEPFTENGREYVMLRKPNGKEFKARIYSETEYNRMYPDAKIEKKRLRSDKEVFGFDKDFIYLVRTEEEDWLEWSNARYAEFFGGWYIPSNEEIPSEQPNDLVVMELPWDRVGKSDGMLLPKTEVRKVTSKFIESSIQNNLEGEWVGKIGERLDLTLEIGDKKTFETKYGKTHTYTMYDVNGNEFQWTTSAKDWEVDIIHHIRGTVKNHIAGKFNKATILTRCMEVS